MLARLRGLWALGPVRGVVASLAIHVCLVLVLLLLATPPARTPMKRGEPLFVELPELPEPAPAGNPAARSSGPPAPQAAAPKQAPPRPGPSAAPPAAPQAPPRAVTPPSRPPVVASRPTPTPPPPPAPEPRAQDVVEAPKPPPAPATPEPPREASPAPEPPAPAQPNVPSPPAPAPAPQVAAIPPSGPVDIRSALGRSGGAGSPKGGGRGGIEGEPIPLDDANPKFNDFLDRLRRKIKANWGFPCIKNDTTRACDYKTTSLVVDFGILKDGRLQFVEIVQSSDFPIYDDYAVNAIKLSSPFPTVPPSMIIAMKQGSTGVAIRARFNYIVDTSLTNLLR